MYRTTFLLVGPSKKIRMMLLGSVNIEGMDDNNISINADDDNHEDGRGLEDLLERIKEENIEMKIERAMVNKICFVIKRKVKKDHGFLNDVKIYVASI